MRGAVRVERVSLLNTERKELMHRRRESESFCGPKLRGVEDLLWLSCVGRQNWRLILVVTDRRVSKGTAQGNFGVFFGVNVGNLTR